MFHETAIPIQDPEDLPKAFAEAWNHKRADQLAALFEADAEFVNVVGLWWHNQEAIYKAHEYGLRVIFPNSRLEVRRVKVKVLSKQIAVVHARMKLVGQSSLSDNQNPGDRFNLFSFVVKKTGTHWRCVSAHNTDIVPGAETHITQPDGSLRSANYQSNA